MCNIGIDLNEFNPEILYICHGRHKDYILPKYHCHNDFLEFTYILSGTITYKVGNDILNLKEGDLLCFNPGVYHEEHLQKGQDVHELYIGFRNIKIKDKPIDFIPHNCDNSFIELKHFGEDFHKTCLDICKEQNNCEIGHELVLKSLVMKLIAIVLKEINYVKSKTTYSQYTGPFYDKSQMVNFIIEYIDKNYMNNISLDNIAKNTYLSPVYISKIFKEETGQSPINHLINLRLRKAKDLLTTTDMSIKSISQQVGYSDAYYFSKLFKKYFGYSPNKFKQKNQKSI